MEVFEITAYQIFELEMPGIELDLLHLKQMTYYMATTCHDKIICHGEAPLLCMYYFKFPLFKQ